MRQTLFPKTHAMTKQITFRVKDKVQLMERIIGFFEHAGFQRNHRERAILTFSRTSSLFEAWESNPLKWKSEIFVTRIDNEVIAEFYVDTESQMFTIEEEKVWDSFINDFQISLQHKSTHDQNTENSISTSKKARRVYFAWIVLGALTGGMVGFLVLKYSDAKMLAYLSIPFFTTLFLRLRINFNKRSSP
jgi:hypothetical protein